MINNNDLKNEYKTHNKIYIPTEYKNQYWRYLLNGDEITIITNNNCYQNYNTTYCDCYRYNEKYNLITESYTCNSNSSNYEIDKNYISDDINDSLRITKDYVNNYTILLLTIILSMIIVSLFKKNSRKI